VAQNKKEFEKAREQLGDRDLIMVDTIGKNFLRKDHVRDLQDAFSNCGDTHHFLVLSATAKDNDLRQTIFHFGPMDVGSIIFTKVDETLSHGCIINQLLRFPYALSYLGIGQRVPEDIELATHKRLLSLLFPSGTGTTRKE
jgi:flagellar biosynthesis protein FlhF